MPKDYFPSIDTIYRFLKFECLIEPYHHRTTLPTTIPSVGKFPHDCWQIDDKGNDEYPDIGYVCLISAKDTFTRIYSQSAPVFLKTFRGHPTKTDYQRVLRKAFESFGLPFRIQADHGSIFFESHSNSPYPTQLHLWLLGVGIVLSWSRSHLPTDQAFVERMHETLKRRMLRTKPYKSKIEFINALKKEVYELNNIFPCSTLGNRSPLKAYPEARHSKIKYSAATESKLFKKERILDYLNGKEWFRTVSKDNTVSLGKQVYYIKKAVPEMELKVVANAKNSTFYFYNVNELIDEIPIKGIDYKSLKSI